MTKDNINNNQKINFHYSFLNNFIIALDTIIINNFYSHYNYLEQN